MPGSDSPDEGSAANSSSIDQIVREGARRMLAEALQAEFDAYIAAFTGVLDERTAGGWWRATVITPRVKC